MTYNNLGGIGILRDDKLATLFFNIPSSVTSLDLRENNLAELTNADLAKAFKNINQSVQTIRLCKSDIDGRRHDDEWSQLIATVQQPRLIMITDRNKMTEYPLTSSNNNMQVLAGFMLAIGGLAVATALILLAATTVCVTALALTGGLGGVAMLGGLVGLFAHSCRNKQPNPDMQRDSLRAQPGT